MPGLAKLPSGSAHAPSAYIITIGPEDAAAYLEGNKKNRNIHETHVQKLARAMRDGAWKLNGDTIKITRSGLVIDGQHRLWACIESGTPFQTFIVTGLDDSDDLFSSCGEQLARTTKNLFAYHGVKHYSSAASVTQLMWFHQKLNIESWSVARVVPSHAELWEVYKSTPGIADAVTATMGIGLLPSSVAGFCYWAFTRSDERKAVDFFEKLRHGTNLTENMAIFWLRNRLESDMVRREKISRRVKLALTIKAWNLHRMGLPAKMLRWIENEKFPAIS